MSNELEKRVESLEREMRTLKDLLAQDNDKKDWRSTFGMFANDPLFEEIVRLGREYRAQQREP